MDVVVVDPQHQPLIPPPARLSAPSNSSILATTTVVPAVGATSTPLPAEHENLTNNLLTLDAQSLQLLSALFFCAMSTLCVFGVIANALSLLVYTRASLRSRSINRLLAALAASDFATCLLAVPVLGAQQLEQLAPSWADRTLALASWAGYPLAVMCQSMSVWLLVAITVDRYLAVCHPFAVRTYSTRGRAMLTIAVIVVFSIVYNLVRFWEFEPVADRWHDPNVTGVNNLIQPLLRESSLYMLLYQNAATMITQFVLPLFVLGALNLQVARTILRAGVERKQLVASEKREHSTAKMMLYVVIVFLVCYVFSFVLNVIETLHTELFNADVGYFLNDVNNFLVVVNSSSSFCFYCKYSTRFRTELHRLTGLTLPPCCGTTPVQSARGSGPAATTTTECSHLVSPPPQAPLADRSFNSCIIEDDEKVIDLQGDDDEAVVIANDSSTDHSLLPSPPVAVSNGSAARHHHHHQHHHHQPSLAPVVTFERTTNV